MERIQRVVARFDQPDEAREAMFDLEVKGIDADATGFGESARPWVSGAILGTMIGAAVVIAVLAVARVEPLGPSMLSGAVAGALGGSLIGAYWGATVRLPVNEDGFDTVAIDGSASVVVEVRVEDSRLAAAAVAVLRRHHAQQIDREVA